MKDFQKRSLAKKLCWNAALSLALTHRKVQLQTFAFHEQQQVGNQAVVQLLLKTTPRPSLWHLKYKLTWSQAKSLHGFFAKERTFFFTAPAACLASACTVRGEEPRTLLPAGCLLSWLQTEGEAFCQAARGMASARGACGYLRHVRNRGGTLCFAISLGRSTLHASSLPRLQLQDC